MRLHRFFVEKEINTDDKYIVTEERLIHQWRDVFRYNVGSKIILFDGSGFEYEAIIEVLTNRESTLCIISKIKGIIIDRKINLYQSIIKKDKMELVAEKCTELGFSKLVPILSERSEKKNLNFERLNKILIEASEQCGRVEVPILQEIMDLEKALDLAIALQETIIIFHTKGEKLNVDLKESKSISVFIGPEGGWSDSELKLFEKKKAHIFRMGPLTLRADTAAIVAVSLMIQ